MAQPGRNESCWCGSGLKYKRCHLHRENQAPESKFDIRKKFFALSKQRFCFCGFDAERCSSVLASSHSISKSGSLKLIAERSHVAAIKGDFGFVDGVQSYFDSLRIAEISINKASTFGGFCEFHDAKLFAELDRLYFRDRSIFFWQLVYRAAAYEKYQKIVAVDFTDQVRLLDKGASLAELQRVQFHANFQKWSHGEGLKNINILLNGIEDAYQAQAFDRISYCYFLTDRRLPFAGLGFFQPSMTMDGWSLQRVNLVFSHELFRSSPLSESVCIAAIPMKGSTLLCLCCLRHQSRSKEFIESIRGSGKVVSLFLGAMMLSIENVYFTPSYLRRLSDESLSLLKRLSSLGIAEDVRQSDVVLARSVSLFDDVAVIEREAS